MERVSMTRESEPGGELPSPPAVSPYPYGLRLNLSQEELGKLGYEGLPPAGTTLHLDAIGVVTRASSEDPDADGDIDYLCVEIQITELGVEEESASAGEDADEDAGNRAGRLYGGKK